jgi:hypothetical protein
MTDSFTWDDLVSYKDDPHGCKKNFRTQEFKKRFDEMIQTTLEERTIFMMNLLGFNSNETNVAQYVLRDNDYPYNVTPGIRHMVLFINPKYQDKYTEQDLEAIIVAYKLEKSYQDYLWFEQIPERKSLPTIPHYHVFYR